MDRIVIGIADQVMAGDLRSRLEDIDGIEVAYVADSAADLLAAVLRHTPSVLLVHETLEEGPSLPVVRDLVLRQPALAVLVVTSNPTAATYSAAMEVGARSVVSYPFSFEDLAHRVSTSIEWAAHMRGLVSSGASAGGSSGATDGRVVTFTGAKGGVGTTVLATHLAWDLATKAAGVTVCLVDLDLEKGDVPSFLDVSHRVSIADLAKISDDITARSVADVVAVHNSGLHLLLAPLAIRDTEFVTPAAVRQVVAQLRAVYDVVVVDGGAAVTPAQAAAVEMSDEVVQVITSDVPALRAARRQVLAWESLGVREPAQVSVLLNRFTRRSEIQQVTVDELVIGHRLEVLVPDMGSGLERAANSRTPSEVRDKSWWTSLRALSSEI
ncbi:MAG TPA: AAA family ATPase, partial [Actinomycetales bacterium]